MSIMAQHSAFERLIEASVPILLMSDLLNLSTS
jgi:hypothetical protein